METKNRELAGGTKSFLLCELTKKNPINVSEVYFGKSNVSTKVTIIKLTNTQEN